MKPIELYKTLRSENFEIFKSLYYDIVQKNVTYLHLEDIENSSVYNVHLQSSGGKVIFTEVRDYSEILGSEDEHHIYEWVLRIDDYAEELIPESYWMNAYKTSLRVAVKNPPEGAIPVSEKELALDLHGRLCVMRWWKYNITEQRV